jgi:hypothetical protein
VLRDEDYEMLWLGCGARGGGLRVFEYFCGLWFSLSLSIMKRECMGEIGGNGNGNGNDCYGSMCTYGRCMMYDKQ